jgi:hypothetical protein
VRARFGRAVDPDQSAAWLTNGLFKLTAWLDARDVAAISEIRGRMSRDRLGHSFAFERANYVTILHDWAGDGPRR